MNNENLALALWIAVVLAIAVSVGLMIYVIFLVDASKLKLPDLPRIYRLNEQLNRLLRDPEIRLFFELLDDLSRFSAFVIRPTSRVVRFSLWLVKEDAGELRIVSGYEIPLSTRTAFVQKVNGIFFTDKLWRRYINP